MEDNGEEENKENERRNNTFNKLKYIQTLIRKESSLRGLCKHK